MYNKRTWLNKKKSSSTGSVVAFCGNTKYKDKSKESTYLEVADCFGKITLHQTEDDTRKDFIHKMKVLRNEIDSSITWIKINYAQRHIRLICFIQVLQRKKKVNTVALTVAGINP